MSPVSGGGVGVPSTTRGPAWACVETGQRPSRGSLQGWVGAAAASLVLGERQPHVEGKEDQPRTGGAEPPSPSTCCSQGDVSQQVGKCPRARSAPSSGERNLLEGVIFNSEDKQKLQETDSSLPFPLLWHSSRKSLIFR